MGSFSAEHAVLGVTACGSWCAMAMVPAVSVKSRRSWYVAESLTASHFPTHHIIRVAWGEVITYRCWFAGHAVFINQPPWSDWPGAVLFDNTLYAADCVAVILMAGHSGGE